AAALVVLIAIGGILLLRGGKHSPRTHGAASPPAGTPTPAGPSPTVTSSPIPAEPNSVLRIDPKSNTVSADITVGVQPQAVAFSGGNLWVVNVADHTISRIDPGTNEVDSTGGGLTGPCNL